MKKIIILIAIMSILVICLNGCVTTAPTETMPPQSTVPSSETAPNAQSPTPDNTQTQTTPPSSEAAPYTQSPAPTPNQTESASTETADGSQSPAPIFINEMTDKEEGTFYLGQSITEVMRILEDMDIFIKTGDEFTINTEGFGFGFDQNKLIGIGLLTASNTPTASGLNFGDSYEKMVEIYGTDYTEKVIGPDASRYEYKIGNHYFRVRIYKGGVNLWGLSTESLINLGIIN